MVETVQQRRALLKHVVSASTLALVATSGLLLPRRLLAMTYWPTDAFNAETVEDVLLALLGQAEIADDIALRFKVGSPPSYAVNGAKVPIEIHSELTGIERIVVIVEKNPLPLAMILDVTPAIKLPFKSMIRVSEDSLVLAVVRANSKLYKTTRFVEVDIGGCG